MDKRLYPAMITAARKAGFPIRMIRDDQITWAGATPDAATRDAILAAAALGDRQEAVRAECRRRIYAIASAEAQSNMALAQGQIAARPGSGRSAGDLALLAGVAAALDWVTQMRAAYAALSADPDADYTSDTAWPDCPAEAKAVAAQF
ncbi:hypothetical protein [Palleronia caenipelagi]|uniref:Uncharacterized protein n=1 Tax=Palleronia caenipelagi TaxID=2489174 RepID=A0A547PWA0_9RHOB|nr:hypothetical protein [Palleronia caenipelagi]TRD18398.1 hypothetical protein FEV53_12130 [Palleronia caenipelagi]